ncbi:hypothetical protein [Ciceribacter azotifigens]|uniref:hypothetical protein n=1 Tax=Ciceribacter azotifigens TaxID=2069303 RepID=UPI003A8890BB
MSVKERIRRYRETGGASDLVRVEVLVPKARREEILTVAAEFRAEHRSEKARLAEFIRIATKKFGLRVFDNIDTEGLNDLPQKARVIANALMERGDARAYALGRQMISQLETGADGTDAAPARYHGLHRREPFRQQLYRPRDRPEHGLAAHFGRHGYLPRYR